MDEECDEASLARIEGFCRALEAERNASVHTVRAYRGDLVDFARYAQRKGFAIGEADMRQLRGYLAELDRAQYSRTTVNRRLSSLRAFYRWLNVTGVCEGDPASALQGPKLPQRLPTCIRPADMAKILAVHCAWDERGRLREQSPVDMRNQAILEFLYACGARISETSGLLERDVDWDQGQVKVFGKGSKERIIPLHEMALRTMRSYAIVGRPRLLGDKSCAHFFVSTRGNPMGTDAMRKMFKETLRIAGVDETLSPHDMRHTFATDLLNGGADLRSVQEMLGHAGLSTTQIYTHLTSDRLKEVHARAHPRG